MAYPNFGPWQPYYAPSSPIDYPSYSGPQPIDSRYPGLQSAPNPCPQPAAPPIGNRNPFLEASPFRLHLDTNYVPSSEEIQSLRTVLAEIQPEIDAAKKEITRLEEELSRISLQISHRQEYVAKHKALLTPIRHAPVEILQEIFYNVVYGDTVHHGSSMHKDDAPVVLTRVCRTWREIALRTPGLWASLHITIPQDPEPGTTLTPLRVLGIEEWIRRSGSVPLTISIFEGWSGRPGAIRHVDGWGTPLSTGLDQGVDASTSLKQIVDCIRPSARRWRILRLGIPFISILPFLDIPASELVTLEEFSFNNLSGSTNGGYLPSILERFRSSGLVHSPLLSRLYLFHYPSSNHLLSYSINWNQITHLSFGDTTPYATATNTPMFEEYLQLLGRIQETIEYLSLSVRRHRTRGTNEQTSTDPQPVVILNLPRLKQLVIREQDYPCPALGNAIRCPALEVLEYYELAPVRRTIRVEDDEGPWTPPHDLTASRPDGSLGTILAHSGSSIKTLITAPYVFSNEMIIRYLSYTPLLEAVRFTNGIHSVRRVTNHGEILKALVSPFPNPSHNAVKTTPPSPTAGSNVLCPRLTRIEWTNTSAFTVDEFLDFIKLKQGGSLEGVAKLTRVVIHLDSMIPKERREILDRSFPKDVLQCFITYDPPMVQTGSMLRDGLRALVGNFDDPWA